MLTRRGLLSTGITGLSVMTGLGPLGCLGRKRVSAEEIAGLYAAGNHAGVEDLMPGGQRVVVRDLVFHDWAYPDPERVAATQAEPERWAEVTKRDADGGSVYHGIKLRLPGEHDDDQLHRSGPKLIAFLPDSEGRAVRLLKQAYRERFELTCTVSWIGVLTDAVWDDYQVTEDDMVGLHLHGVRRF